MMMHDMTTARLSRSVRLLSLLAALTLLPPPRALAAQQDLNRLNVMILADNSSSMNTAIEHEAYDKGITYPGRFSSTAEYHMNRTMTYTPRSFAPTWESTPGAVLVSSDNGEPGIYSGNYLNWIFYGHATADQRAALPRMTRIQVLKVILSDLFYRNDRLDFGLTVFRDGTGCNIIVKCGDNDAALLTGLAGITANAWSPLAEASEDILDYYADDGPTAPITAPDTRSFLIVVTDGEPTMDLDVSPYLQDADGDGRDPGSCTSIASSLPDSCDCSEYFDDVTWCMAHTDLRADLDGEQNIATYVVAYDTGLTLLESAAKKGDGLYFRATDAIGLVQTMELVVQDILRHSEARSPVSAVPDDADALVASRLTVAPNPSSGRTTITWAGDKAAPNAIRIHDLAGKLVRSLDAGDAGATGSQFIWDGRDHRGAASPAGVYLVRMERADGAFVTRKVLLAR